MAMAPPTNFFPHLLILVILTVFTIATSTTKPSLAVATPSSAAKAFLRARCATTKNATTCYKALLPFADSFNGSQVRISSAATAVAYGRQRSFLTELRRLQARRPHHPINVTGPASLLDQALEVCVQSIEVGLQGEEKALSDLRLLNSLVTSKEKGKDALLDVQHFLSGAASSAEECIYAFEDAGDAALVSPVGKEVVAMAKHTDQYVDIALYLLVGITL